MTIDFGTTLRLGGSIEFNVPSGQWDPLGSARRSVEFTGQGGTRTIQDEGVQDVSDLHPHLTSGSGDSRSLMTTAQVKAIRALVSDAGATTTLEDYLGNVFLVGNVQFHPRPAVLGWWDFEFTCTVVGITSILGESP